MDIIIKNVQEKHLALIHELAKSLNFEISEPLEDLGYNPDFVAKIQEGDEDIKAGRTTKITLDGILEREALEKGLADAEAGNLHPDTKAKQLYKKWL